MLKNISAYTILQFLLTGFAYSDFRFLSNSQVTSGYEAPIPWKQFSSF